MDDIEFESAIHRLKYQAIQDFNEVEMNYFNFGYRRGFAKLKKEQMKHTRETKNAYDLGYNYGRAEDKFLIRIVRKKLRELKNKGER